jgi:carboxylate-amine ligase
MFMGVMAAVESKAVPPRAHHFRPGAEYTVGVEEELFLIHPQSGGPAPVVEHVLAAVSDHRVKPELMRCQVEIATTPAREARALLGELAFLRESAGRAAGVAGARLAACGTHPFALAEDQPITERPRYRELVAALRYPARRELCSGMHVHVAVGSADKAVRVIEALLPDLPVLLAASCSSPFWRGEATGLRSTRTVVFQSMPRSGLPPAFASYDGFAASLEQMIAAGAVSDHSFLWWDARPHPRFGTIELRALDVQPNVVDAAALAGVVQSLVRHYGQRYERGERFADADRFVTGENRWLAARHGLAGPLVAEGLAAVPARELLEQLLDRIAPDADAVNASWAIEHVSELASRGTAADRQLRRYRDGEPLASILGAVADETADPARPA